tara:strand:- start:8350 stop:9207 length:858 start_codon:yes stop_codon:yes gene_type:complete
MDENITNKKQKKAVVIIKGGFGNQLFQFAFANYLKSLNFKVSINIDFFNNSDPNSTNRNLVIPVEYFDLKVTTVFEKIYYKFLKKIISNNSNNYMKTFKGYEVNIADTVEINIFDGYWKNLKYLEDQKNYIVDSLKKNKILNESFKNEIKPNSTAIHIRRGDFLKNGWNLDIEFYEESLNYLNENIENFSFDIFTDDPEWVKNQYIFKDVNKIFAQKTNTEIETIETFAKLMNYQNTVIGNSTFSFLSAFIKGSENETVITCDPWYTNSNHPTLAKPGWIKIKNK